MGLKLEKWVSSTLKLGLFMSLEMAKNSSSVIAMAIRVSYAFIDSVCFLRLKAFVKADSHWPQGYLILHVELLCVP